jgi:hypothetical protein
MQISDFIISEFSDGGASYTYKHENFLIDVLCNNYENFGNVWVIIFHIYPGHPLFNRINYYVENEMWWVKINEYIKFHRIFNFGEWIFDSGIVIEKKFGYYYNEIGDEIIETINELIPELGSIKDQILNFKFDVSIITPVVPMYEIDGFKVKISQPNHDWKEPESVSNFREFETACHINVCGLCDHFIFTKGKCILQKKFIRNFARATCDCWKQVSFPFIENRNPLPWWARNGE